MDESRQMFAQLLAEGLYKIKLREDKPLTLIQDQLGYAIGRDTGGSALTHWRRGNIPASHTDLENLAREMVRRGNLERSWVEQLFAQTEYPAETICAALFPDGETTAVPPQTIHPLPGKDYRPLIGRDPLLKQISDILAALDPPHMVSIDGQGGIGKTALSLDAAHRCQQRGLFASVIWLSVTRPSGPLLQADTSFTLETILDAIGAQSEGEAFADVSLAEKKQLAQAYLARHRVLLVLDNLETAVQPQDEILAQLQPLLGQSKVLATSRHRFRHDTYAIHLTGLENDGAAHFIQQYGQGNGFHHIQMATDGEVDEIIWATGGSPLAMQLVVSQSRHLPLPVVLKNLRAVTPLSQINNEGEYVKFYKFVFHHSWALLNNESKNLLVTMAQFDTANGAPFEAIQHISELEFGILVSCLEILWDSSLLEVRPIAGISQIRYYLHPLTQNFVLSDIVNVL